jgi:HNH endonuclease
VAWRPDLDRYRWQQRRAAVRKRDGNQCVRCGRTEKLSVHHLVKPQHGGDDSFANLVTLCSRCHGLQHSKRARLFRANGNVSTGGIGRPKTIPHRAGVEISPPDYEEELEDDPERGIFWAPPGRPRASRRWSRAWFDWRSEPG